MAATNLEERIAVLEDEMRAVQAQLHMVQETQQPWWERLAGMFENDPLFDEIVAAGQAYRRSLLPSSPPC